MPNDALRRELLALAEIDRRTVERLTRAGALSDGYHPEIEALHRRNAARLAEIIDQHGWPGKSLVGEDGAEAAWLIVQHDITDPKFVRRCLPLIEEAASAGEARLEHAAKLIDRVRVFEGRKQIFGTHYDWGEDGEMRPLPIEDPHGVDERRRRMGLPPLGEQTRKVREQTLERGELPPPDVAARNKRADEWAIAVGWRDEFDIDVDLDADEPAHLSTYDARWPAFFFDEARRIGDALGPAVLGIEHIGSTAVPGMVAIPIIDILVGLRWCLLSDEQRDALEIMGYEYLGETDEPGRLYLRLRGDKSFNLVVVEHNAPIWRADLTLRDFLRSNPEIARAYAQHKRRAVNAGSRTLLAYSERKAPFLEKLVEQAAAWSHRR